MWVLYNTDSIICLNFRSHGGHPSIRAHHRPRRLLLPDAFSPVWLGLQAAGTWGRRHGSADYAAPPWDPEPSGGAEITSIPGRKPLHPFLLQAWRAGRSQDPGCVKRVCVCVCDRRGVRVIARLEVLGERTRSCFCLYFLILFVHDALLRSSVFLLGNLIILLLQLSTPMSPFFLSPILHISAIKGSYILSPRWKNISLFVCKL